MATVNPANLNFISGTLIDKIVGIYEGQFDAGTSTIVVTYTFGGIPYNVWYYVIPHPFQRPVFCEVLTSIDGDTYTNNASIAFSDASNIYIYAGQGSAPSGTIYYKLTAIWIDNYDISTPAITPIIQGTSALYYKSTANLQKIFKQDVVTLANDTSISVAHDLGYYPNSKVFMECFNGQVWPCHAGGPNDLFLFGDNENTGYWKIGNSDITISCDLNAVSFGASRFWYRIYYDN